MLRSHPISSAPKTASTGSAAPSILPFSLMTNGISGASAIDAGAMATRVLVDLPEPVALDDRDLLVLDDGRHAEIIAARGGASRNPRPRPSFISPSFAWHIGNRHLAAAIEAERILILRDHVIEAMLEGLGATVAEVVEPFEPVRGAYSGQAGATATHMATIMDDHGLGQHDHGHDHPTTMRSPRIGRVPAKHRHDA